jgi:hypothetical protein
VPPGSPGKNTPVKRKLYPGCLEVAHAHQPLEKANSVSVMLLRVPNWKAKRDQNERDKYILRYQGILDLDELLIFLLL